MNPAGILWFPLLLTEAILLSVCTAALWEADRFTRYHQPATPSNLKLYHSADTDDMLVRYDEKREGSKRTKPCAYWLRGDGEPASNPCKRHFVPVKQANPLAAIPLIESRNAVPPLANLYAVPGANAHDFTLFSREKMMGHFELPEYMDPARERSSSC